MKMLRLAVLLTVSFFAQSVVNPAENRVVLTNQDRAAIIQAVMESKLKSEGPLRFSEYLIISTENMSSVLLPKIPGFRFKLMRPAEIRRREKHAARFRYLIMDELKDWNGRSLNFDLAIIERCGGLPCHSHLYKYSFEKVDNKWQGKIFMVIC
jgi:hypothetical protein